MNGNRLQHGRALDGFLLCLLILCAAGSCDTPAATRDVNACGSAAIPDRAHDEDAEAGWTAYPDETRLGIRLHSPEGEVYELYGLSEIRRRALALLSKAPTPIRLVGSEASHQIPSIDVLIRVLEDAGWHPMESKTNSWSPPCRPSCSSSM